MTRSSRIVLVLSLAIGFVFASMPASAATYVLTAGKWGAAQEQAVVDAGGTVTFTHGRTGIVVVESDSPGFLLAANAAGKFSSVSQDFEVEWQPQVRTLDAGEAAVTPGDETFAAAQWAPTAVEAQGAWAAGYTGQGVRVAVLDGGIYNTHIDLVGQIDTAASRSFVPGFAYNQDTGTFWHGTHVAGIVAAKDNAIGTIGIAPGATIVGVKVLHNGSGQFAWIIQGILYASTPLAEGGAGADIINMSLGATFPRNAGGAAPLIAALNKAINYAASNGVLCVSSAGNDGFDMGQMRNSIKVPAQSGTGIAVSATGPLGFGKGATNFRRVASYTDYGEDLVTIAGPGGDYMLEGNEICVLPRVPSGTIVQYCWALDMVMSTVRGGSASTSSYGWAAGTSMAAPAVSAVAALIKQKYPNISLGGLEAKLLNSADDEGKAGHDEFYGRGFVNARRAVE
jgi:subtilisin family serine protease